ncbi:N-acetylmuramoyl-L-alanine amidase [Zobellia galactanivorans]|uniref:N-acetylmuramoyl-L-alanine amidase family protein n=1 Tax=Zobellia galactanivorans (strain DSM 12802 / CCUG 47099 / CIP 106680 / NCIMB 13871 / Dsij) TaxID=63186 RepID=UPI0026E284E1|nr:N-acetylmuramoyl-L-alanine amidase [Zobellia galactanivorans]MDO6811138.1 N-acetylmuramoyl-L-alanine amidase [Zobellia galactanivorans]
MKRTVKNVSFVILLLKSLLLLSQESAPRKVVVIDPGHGGKDTGAIGMNGIQEKDLVLKAAIGILKLNRDLEEPLDIYLTRYSDTLISLSDRTKLAIALKADLFVSLHCNYSDSPSAKGVEVYVADRPSKYQDYATWLAFQLQDYLSAKLGLESRGVKFADFQVLREVGGGCPAMLLELGFLSNRDEGNYYQTSESVRALALLLRESLFEGLNLGERAGQ